MPQELTVARIFQIRNANYLLIAELFFRREVAETFGPSFFVRPAAADCFRGLLFWLPRAGEIVRPEADRDLSRSGIAVKRSNENPLGG
jgi:hypothetical protein